MNNSSLHDWYVVQTKPKKEEVVCQHLKGINIETFHPKIRSRVEWNRFCLKPLFPSYVFVKTFLGDPHLHRLVQFTRGVVRILGMQFQPVPVSEDVVETIRKYMDGDNILERCFLKVGGTVRVKRGPLCDLIGILEKPVSAKGRVQVLLQLMQRQIRTVLHCSQLEQYS